MTMISGSVLMGESGRGQKRSPLPLLFSLVAQNENEQTITAALCFRDLNFPFKGIYYNLLFDLECCLRYITYQLLPPSLILRY